jgi:hypothetical protein
MAQVDGFRYRMEDALRGVTRATIREARVREIKNEVVNSDRLKVRMRVAVGTALTPGRPISRTTPPTWPTSATTSPSTRRASSPTSSTSRPTSCPGSPPSGPPRTPPPPTRTPPRPGSASARTAAAVEVGAAVGGPLRRRAAGVGRSRTR